MPSPCRASPPSANLPEVSEASPQGTCFDASSPECWREPSAVSLTRPPARFSSHCRPEPVPTAWRRCCVQLSNSTPGPRSSLSMGEVLTIPSAAQLYLPSYGTVSLLSFTRAMYARTSTHLWWDDGGRVHDIAQAEGVEQGDPLAPGLYALGQHDSLVAASASLRPDERLAAFLDDLYVVTVPERAAPLLRVVTGEVERGAGVEANLGKTRVFNAAGGDAPPGVDVLGPDVWCGNLPPEQRGFVALGVPIGHTDFVKAQAAIRLDAEADLLRKLTQLPDFQCVWLLLAFCAAPRA